jgi:arylsulfatase A-like enzyme
MKKGFSLILSALPLYVFAQTPKNVVIVFVDQLSPWALSCYGNTEIKTSNIDLLANNGVIFNNAYCAKAVSTPSRGCMLTGLYPFAHKAINNQQLLDPSVETYADVFNTAGYETAYIGKWHLAGEMGENLDGTPDPHWSPTINGRFKDVTYMYNNGHWKNIVDVKNNVPKVSNDISDNPNEYGTDWIFQKGFEYISKHKNDPFCLVLSPPDPHPALKVRAPYDTMVNQFGLSIPLSYYESNLVNQKLDMPYAYNDENVIRKNKSQYLGMVLCLDDYIGKLISFLKKENLYDKTIIIFTSDHGEMMGEFRHKGKAAPYNSAYQIPLIFKMPETNKHIRIDELYCNIDFKPTIAGLLNLKTEGKVHGHDMSEYILNKKQGVTDKTLCLDFFKSAGKDKAHVVIVNKEYWFAAIFNTEAKNIISVSNILLYDRVNDKHQLFNLHGNKKYIPIEKNMVAKLRKELERVNHPNLKDVTLIENVLK